MQSDSRTKRLIALLVASKKSWVLGQGRGLLLSDSVPGFSGLKPWRLPSASRPFPEAGGPTRGAGGGGRDGRSVSRPLGNPKAGLPHTQGFVPSKARDHFAEFNVSPIFRGNGDDLGLRDAPVRFGTEVLNPAVLLRRRLLPVAGDERRGLGPLEEEPLEVRQVQDEVEGVPLHPFALEADRLLLVVEEGPVRQHQADPPPVSLVGGGFPDEGEGKLAVGDGQSPLGPPLLRRGCGAADTRPRRVPDDRVEGTRGENCIGAEEVAAADRPAASRCSLFRGEHQPREELLFPLKFLDVGGL